MNHIIVDFQPFVLKQNVLVYKEGVCIDQVLVEAEHVTDAVNALSKQYDIKQIDLCGSRNYLSRYQKEMYSKFANNDYKIDIL